MMTIIGTPSRRSSEEFLVSLFGFLDHDVDGEVLLHSLAPSAYP